MSSNNSAVDQLNAATSIVVLVGSAINCILGAVGLTFNIFVFTRPSLRDEPCSLFFFSSTCFSLYLVYVAMPLRVLANSFNIDMTNYNLGLCKIENFSFYLARSTSCWFIALACFDRFCHSSASAAIRRMSSIKIARWTVVITSVTITLLYSHMVIYYEITNVSDRFGNITPLCNGRSGIYRTFLGFWYMALYSLCPSFFMLLFGFLTLNNIRQRRQVVPTVAGTNQLVRRTDNQLLRMLIAQMLVIIISTLPFSVYQLYAAFTSNFSKSTLQLAQENLAARVVGVMTYFAHTTSFYLYTLTGTVFRKELRRIIGQCWN